MINEKNYIVDNMNKWVKEDDLEQENCHIHIDNNELKYSNTLIKNN